MADDILVTRGLLFDDVVNGMLPLGLHFLKVVLGGLGGVDGNLRIKGTLLGLDFLREHFLDDPAKHSFLKDALILVLP